MKIEEFIDNGKLPFDHPVYRDEIELMEGSLVIQYRWKKLPSSSWVAKPSDVRFNWSVYVYRVAPDSIQSELDKLGRKMPEPLPKPKESSSDEARNERRRIENRPGAQPDPEKTLSEDEKRIRRERAADRRRKAEESARLLKEQRRVEKESQSTAKISDHLKETYNAPLADVVDQSPDPVVDVDEFLKPEKATVPGIVMVPRVKEAIEIPGVPLRVVRKNPRLDNLLEEKDDILSNFVSVWLVVDGTYQRTEMQFVGFATGNHGAVNTYYDSKANWYYIEGISIFLEEDQAYQKAKDNLLRKVKELNESLQKLDAQHETNKTNEH